MRNAWLSLVLMVVATPVLAQEQAPPPTPRFDVCVGYQARWSLDDGTQHLDPPGRGNTVILSFGWNITRAVAVVVNDVRFGVSTSQSNGTQFQYSILAGPRVRFANSSRLTPFGQVLFGAARGSVQQAAGGPFDLRTLFQVGASGGLDLGVTKPVALRLLQVEVRHVFGGPGPDSSLALSAGVVIRFGTHVDRERK